MDYFSKKIKAVVASIKSLFTKLNSIRIKHKDRPDVSGLSNEFKEPNSLAQKKKSKPDVITTVKTDLNTLITNIPNAKSNTTITTAYNKITIPDVKDLLKASDFNSIIDTINALDTLCSDCNNCTSDYKSDYGNCGSDCGDYSHHTDHSVNGSRLANYTDRTAHGECSSQYGTNQGGYISKNSAGG